MAKLSEIIKFLDGELELKQYDDHSLNGLQVEGESEITSIAVSVDAGESVIEDAIKSKANLLIVHHGLFWGPAQSIAGSRRRVVKSLLDSGMNLYAAHLPLDGHITLGNNAALAKHLNLTNVTSAFDYNKATIGCIADGNGKTLEDYEAKLKQLPGTSPILTLPFGPKKPQKVGIVSGAGLDYLKTWQDYGFDTFITGEPRQSAFHFAKENGLNVICAGHYRTETLGVKNLGELLKNKFDTPWNFIDAPTGI